MDEDRAESQKQEQSRNKGQIVQKQTPAEDGDQDVGEGARDYLVWSEGLGIEN